MEFKQVIVLKNGEEALIRNATEEDGEAVLSVFKKTHLETDYLLTYPQEMAFTVEKEAAFLSKKQADAGSVELLLVYRGMIIATSGVDPLGFKMKIAHRCEMGISVLQEFWGLGAGKALVQACIECARAAGYLQMELSVVRDNERAVGLYKKMGFVEIGLNERGFRKQDGTYQALITMALPLV